MLRRITALAGGAILTAALAMTGLVTAAQAAPAFTVTCVACVHVQNEYAFRGALDAVHQATAVNSPIGLWYETATTTDPGADMQVLSAGSVTASTVIQNFGLVNQSHLNWVDYLGDSVVRFKYDPFGNGGANTYIGLNGTKLALRHDNPNSIWQEFIEVPVSAVGLPDGTAATNGLGGVLNACGSPVTANPAATSHCVLIDVGQTLNPDDPFIVSDPQDAFTGSLVQQDVEQATINQFDAVATSQVWDFRA